MPRSQYGKSNFLKKDPKYNNFLVSLTINKILKNGKKNLANFLIYRALYLLERRTKNVLKFLETAINKVRPRISLKELSFKKGSKTAIIPFELFKSLRVGIKWLILSAITRSKKPFYVNLSNEIFDAVNNRGLTIRKKKEYHKYVNLKRTAL